MTRYHPALVALHWLMALLIIMMLIFGNFVTGPLANSDPAKIEALTGHMAIGMSLGVLLIIRLIVKRSTDKPPHAKTGNAMLDRLGIGTHHLMYLLVALMVLSGLGMAFGFGLFGVVYGGEGVIPEALSTSIASMIHNAVSNILVILLALHVLAALYHQFRLRDRLFSRMWFGDRTGS